MLPDNSSQAPDHDLSDLERRMTAAIIFMPEIGHLTAGVTTEIIRRCVRVAIEFGAQSVAGQP